MLSFKRVASLFLLIFSLSGSVAPSLAWARGCAITCVSGSRTQVVNSTSMATDADCQKLCTGAPAQGTTPAVVSACNSLRPAGYTCRGPAVFTPDGTDPSSPVCSCTCVPAAGAQGSPVTVQTSDHCPTITVASPACVQSCAARCASPTAPVTAGMRPDPARQPSCVAPTGSTTPTVPTPPVNQVNAPAAANRDAVPLTLSQPIDGVTVVSDLGGYIALVYRYVIGLAGTAAVIMIVYGGFRYLLGSAMDDVSAGKTIIQDAIIGLLLVLGSYFILSTVNPNTLSLKLPNIQPITPKAVPLAAPTVITNACGNPVQEARVRRVGAGRSGVVAKGQPCAYDQECQSGICFMHTQTEGVCSDLSEGQRCKCTGSCCEVMTTPNEVSTYLGDTNNRGSGLGVCQNGTVCQFQQDDWKCVALSYGGAGGTVQTGSPIRPEGVPRPVCRLDSECVRTLGAGAACIYNSRQTGSLAGRTECSLGREGDQCQCSGTGCDMVDPPNVRITGVHQATGNNGGTRRIACQTGLVCAPFVRPAGSIERPNDLEYFCQRPASLRSTPAGPALECRFRCRGDGPVTMRRVTGCTQEGTAGVQECVRACAGPCGGAGETACLGVRCVPTTSDYLVTPIPPSAPAPAR
ncbi:hypothetical protein KBD61_04155 [Patescibacteria group bacterium]|nr:hypothetical protein [Patescibacteria group bacterium]MBP9710189.1 hypothetical protein [Patescibacteria group bacterium]